MTAICLLDTSIFLNILNVPGKNQEKDNVVQEYTEYGFNIRNRQSYSTKWKW